jgi:2'-5' RNA ligase
VRDETIRAFFAVELDDATRAVAWDVASALRAGPHGDDVRWVRRENLHVTLRFLGRVETHRLPEITGRVREQTARLLPFRMHLGGARPFPSPRRAKVVVLDVSPGEPLQELAAAVERGVVAAGFPPEDRRFHPHLTLGRAQGRPLGFDSAAPGGAGCHVAESVLFRSELYPDGARYTALERIPLGYQADSITP